MVNYTSITTVTPAPPKREFTISITHDLVPSFKLLVYFAREDGELIADLLEVKVKCELKEKVNKLLADMILLHAVTGGH